MKNTYNELNAMVNLYDSEGNMQLDKDKEAAKDKPKESKPRAKPAPKAAKE